MPTAISLSERPLIRREMHECQLRLRPSSLPTPGSEHELSVDNDVQRSEAGGLLAGSPCLRSAVRGARHRRRELMRDGDGSALDDMLAEIWPEADGSLSLTDTGGAPDAAPTERKISGLRAPILAVEAGVRLWQPVMELSSLPWHELCRAQPSKPMHINRASSAAININSGGVVFFLLFRRKDAPAPPAAAAPEDDVSRDTPGTPYTSSTGDVGPSPRSPARFMTANGSERACVLKVCDGMSSTHSEFFATQLCTPLGVLAPQTRLLRRSHPDWAKLRAAAAGITGGAEVCAQLDESRNQVVLLQTLIPGKPVLRCAEALTPAGLPATARAFGRKQPSTRARPPGIWAVAHG